MSGFTASKATGGANAEPAGIRALRIWLWLCVALVLVMVTVGGATRLTGSGLSITEWRPVTGALPPLSELDWQAEFARYRASPQYELVNKGMTLPEFKFIYWWEWGHRQLGRFIGLFFLAGLLFFAQRRVLSLGRMVLLFGVGLLLGLQGAVGWIMVASGLEPSMTAVAPLKLTLHLVFACLFLGALVAFATLLESPDRPRSETTRASDPAVALAFGVLVLIQIALGGLVAGAKAGLTFNTWPLMDGVLVPAASLLFPRNGYFVNALENAALIQFNHRAGALLVVVAALALAVCSRRQTGASVRTAWIAALTVAQFALGVVTLVLAVPVWAGLAHQALAIALFAIVVRHIAMTWRQRESKSEPTAATL